MLTQEEWADADDLGLLFDLFPASLDEGIVRQKNTPGQLQREVITDRSPGSPYKIQAKLRTCVHGTLSKQSAKPATLIVVDYKVQIAKGNARFSEMTTSFEFSAGEPETLNPSVLAYSPFEHQSWWNITEVARLDKTTHQGQSQPEVDGAKAGGYTVTKDRESEWQQRAFDRGLGIRHYDDHGRANIVEWTLLANEKQGEGVAPSFRVAMLVERDGYACFKARFSFAAKGSLSYKFEAMNNRFLRKTAIDDPIIFSPAMKPFGAMLNGVAIDCHELQSLVEENELIGLSKVWGLEAMSSGTV
jgi:hypothetical protein